MYLLWFQWKMALYIIAYWNQGLILYVFFYEGYTESLQLNLMMKSQCQPCCASITFKVSKNRYVSRLLFVGLLILSINLHATGSYFPLYDACLDY